MSLFWNRNMRRGKKIAGKINEDSNLFMERQYGSPAPSSEAVGYTTFLAPPQLCLGLWLKSREIQGEVWAPLYPPLCHSTVSYKLALAIYLCRDLIRCCCSCWPSAPPEGSSGRRAEMRHSVLWKNWQNRPPEREIFSEIFLWAQFLHSLIFRKALNSFVVTSAPQD